MIFALNRMFDLLQHLEIIVQIQETLLTHTFNVLIDFFPPNMDFWQHVMALTL